MTSPTPHPEVMRDYIIKLTAFWIDNPDFTRLAAEARGYVGALSDDGKAPAPQASAERDSA